MNLNKLGVYSVFPIIILIICIGYFQNRNDNLDRVTIIHPLYAADFSNDNILIGSSHNVFVGKVLQEVGTINGAGGVIETKFDVEIIHNIKGILADTVIVYQTGGTRDGTVTMVESDSKKYPGNDDVYMLQPGSTYIFATRAGNDETEQWLNSHENARKLLSRNDALSNEELKDLALNDEKVTRLTLTYPDEKLLESDTNANNTKNSFESLPEETKEVLRQSN